MASRKAQKEAARQARLEAERAAAAKAARALRIRLAGGGVLGVAAIAAVVIAILAGGSSGGTGHAITPAPNGVKLPAQRITDLAAAAKAAGCATINTPDSVALSGPNRTHVDPSTKVNYATNPPSYGAHYPAPASDGEYLPKDTPKLGYVVHAMEHGRVELQYRPGLPQADVKQLESLFNEGDGSFAAQQYLLLFQNPTNMPYDVAATAWGHVIGCKTFSPAVFDALRAFRLAYTFKAPETQFTGKE
jgi:hypothetical protein